MTLRPYGIVLDGRLELGLEMTIENGFVQEIRTHRGVPDGFIVSPAFVNAHSHFEYRGLLGQVRGDEYWSWIRELTRRKGRQDLGQVRADCHLAAKENLDTGVAVVLEHSDRPFSGEAMSAHGLRGAIMQEVITILEHESPGAKLEAVSKHAERNRSAFNGPVHLNPHAYQTVDRATLESFGQSATPVSIHAAETEHENALTRSGSGPIADFMLSHGLPLSKTGKGVIRSLAELGLVRENAQLVHCCALEPGDVELMAELHASVAHCPRSNARLKCPVAPIADILSAGVRVGIGLDSAASGGPIDMFEELRSALASSLALGRPLTGEQVWAMATTLGHASVAPALEGGKTWGIEEGSSVPLIKVNVSGAHTIQEVIERGRPEAVEWVQMADSEGALTTIKKGPEEV